ncbi:hypothetical protein DSO57_1034665 [Entomophthora muscae]|uniref:Uncharacterized protein n=1 Tax=Entomophthora muscae TaxID=34485 RepID=A0ACC2TB12_9FUNG|nr:hypothetical protein DSO57_1034665 [Entomophthora muscae]
MCSCGSFSNHSHTHPIRKQSENCPFSRAFLHASPLEFTGTQIGAHFQTSQPVLPLDVLQKKQLNFDNPAIAAEDLIYNMVLVNTVPNTSLSSQKSLRGLPQEVEPRAHLKPSSARPVNWVLLMWLSARHQPIQPMTGLAPQLML